MNQNQNTIAGAAVSWAIVAIAAPLITMGVVVGTNLEWLMAPLISEAALEVRVDGFLQRLVLVTGVAAAVAALLRLIGHFDTLPLKPIDLAGKSLGFTAAAYAAGYGIIAFNALVA